MNDPLESALAKKIGALRTLEAVMRWAAAERPPWRLVEVITQDEYTHDIVFAGDGGARYLVFDTT